jgi:hypothetical protein
VTHSLSNCTTNGKGGTSPAADEAGEIRPLVLHFSGGSVDDARNAAESAAMFLAERGVPRPTTAYAEDGGVAVIQLPGGVGEKMTDACIRTITEAVRRYLKSFPHYRAVRVEPISPDKPLKVREWRGCYAAGRSEDEIKAGFLEDESRPWLASVRELIASGAVDFVRRVGLPGPQGRGRAG